MAVAVLRGAAQRTDHPVPLLTAADEGRCGGPGGGRRRGRRQERSWHLRHGLRPVQRKDARLATAPRLHYTRVGRVSNGAESFAQKRLRPLHLRQRRRAVAEAQQGFDDHTVERLLQRIDFQGPPGCGQNVLPAAVRPFRGHEQLQDPQHALLPPAPLAQHPLFKVRAVAGETVQEGAAPKIDGLVERLLLVRRKSRLLTGGQQGRRGGEVRGEPGLGRPPEEVRHVGRDACGRVPTQMLAVAVPASKG